MCEYQHKVICPVHSKGLERKLLFGGKLFETAVYQLVSPSLMGFSNNGLSVKPLIPAGCPKPLVCHRAIPDICIDNAVRLTKSDYILSGLIPVQSGEQATTKF